MDVRAVGADNDHILITVYKLLFSVFSKLQITSGADNKLRGNCVAVSATAAAAVAL